MKNKKPINPLEPEEEDDDEKLFSQIVVGDLMVSSKSGLHSCKKTIKGLLEDKTIKNYLGFYNQKKMFGSPPSYID